MILTTILAAKVKSAAMAAHQSAQLAGIMLDSNDPPLCTNIAHNQITCADSDLPRRAWCEACRRHAERQT